MFRLSTAKLIWTGVLFFFISVYCLPYFNFFGIQPDLWVLLLLFYAFRIDWKQTPALAIAIGLLKDVLSTRFFGIEVFSLGLSTLFLTYALGKVERDDPVIMLGAIFLFSILYEFISCGSYVFLNAGHLFWKDLFVKSFWISVYNLAASFFVFPVLQSVLEGRWKYRRRREVYR